MARPMPRLPPVTTHIMHRDRASFPAAVISSDRTNLIMAGTLCGGSEARQSARISCADGVARPGSQPIGQDDVGDHDARR